jgi:type VI secretion system secreted protein VgrG
MSVYADLRKLVDDFTQDDRLIKLTTPLRANLLLAEHVRGEKGIGKGFTFQVSALSTDGGISLRSLIAQPVLIAVVK